MRSMHPKASFDLIDCAYFLGEYRASKDRQHRRRRLSPLLFVGVAGPCQSRFLVNCGIAGNFWSTTPTAPRRSGS